MRFWLHLTSILFRKKKFNRNSTSIRRRFRVEISFIHDTFSIMKFRAIHGENFIRQFSASYRRDLDYISTTILIWKKNLIRVRSEFDFNFELKIGQYVTRFQKWNFNADFRWKWGWDNLVIPGTVFQLEIDVELSWNNYSIFYQPEITLISSKNSVYLIDCISAPLT